MAGSSWGALSAGWAGHSSLVLATFRLQRLLHASQSGTTEPVDMRHNVVQARPTEAFAAVDRHLYWVWHNLWETLAEGELIESAMQADAKQTTVWSRIYRQRARASLSGLCIRTTHWMEQTVASSRSFPRVTSHIRH